MKTAVGLRPRGGITQAHKRNLQRLAGVGIENLSPARKFIRDSQYERKRADKQENTREFVSHPQSPFPG
jgi:hypothetical protein